MALLKHFFILTMIILVHLSLNAQNYETGGLELSTKNTSTSISSLKALSQDSLLTKRSWYITYGVGGWSQAFINAEFPLDEKKATTSYKQYLRTSLGVSIGWWDEAYPAFGASYTGVLGKRNNHFDFSLGAAFIAEGAHPIIDLGYRYQKPEGGFLFKVFLLNIGLGIGFGSSF